MSQPPLRLASHPIISQPAVASGAGEVSHALAILFVGNSYTFSNDLPGMVAAIAASDPGNATRLEVQSATQAEATLKDIYADPAALSLLQSRHWDYVVLQEQSAWALSAATIDATAAAAAEWRQAIAVAGGETVLFLTWARQEDSDWYRQFPGLKNPDHMQKRLDFYTYQLAKRIGAAEVPVGDYWRRALAEDPGVRLYQADGSTPSPAGTYLAALLFYRYFSGNRLQDVSYVPDGVSPGDAARLREIAGE